MNVNWQAYEDGLLSREDTALVDEFLAKDPLARAELDGLRRLKAGLVATKELEPVPLRSLKAKCFKKRDRKRVVLWVGGLAAAAAAMAWTWTSYLYEPMPDYGPIVCSKAITEPLEAANYARAHSKLFVNVLDPSPLARIKTVTAGDHWAQYELEYNGRIIALKVRPASGLNLQMGAVERKGQKYTYTQVKNEAMIVWVTSQFNFNLKGPSSDDIWPLAEDLAKKTLDWR